MTDGQVVKFGNGQVLKSSALVNEYLYVRGPSVVDGEKLFFDERRYHDHFIDCCGAVLAPGFIDVQINGCLGVDFSLAGLTVSDVRRAASHLVAYGVTGFCPTVVTTDPDTYRQVLPPLRDCVAQDGPGARVLGIHLEGPFISADKPGAHRKDLLRNPVNGLRSLVEVYGSLDAIAIVTLAPELPGAMETVGQLAKRGIVVAIGHSAANFSLGAEAVERGAGFITHLFNAMLPFHHRDPGLVGLIASNDSTSPLYYGLIADGLHSHAATMRIAYRTSPSALVLVTDAVSASYQSPGAHRVGEQDVELTPDGQVLLRGTRTLYGSNATMEACVRNLHRLGGASLVDALRAASARPAHLLRLPRKGHLLPGADADVTLLDPQRLCVWATLIAGRCAFVAPDCPAALALGLRSLVDI